MATQLGASKSTTDCIIKIALQPKLEKQRKVYQINAAQVDKMATMFVAYL